MKEIWRCVWVFSLEEEGRRKGEGKQQMVIRRTTFSLAKEGRPRAAGKMRMSGLIETPVKFAVIAAP